VQGLQARADGLLVLDYRPATQLHVDLYDAVRCQTVARTTLPPLALTVPTSACTLANLPELQAVLDQAQAHDDVIINDWTLPSDSDLTNQDGPDLTTSCGRTKSESWIGTGASLSNSYLGFRFHGLAIPARAQLLAATLQLTNNHSTQEVKTAFEVRAELARAPAPFLCTAARAPGLRPTTSSSGSYAGNDKWLKHARWPLDVTAPVTDWVRGGFASDTLALIAKGTGSAGERKFFYNTQKNNLDRRTLPTLTIAYRLPPVISNAQALQTFLESLAGFESFQLARDGLLTVKLQGQTYRGQLTSEVVAGPPPADGVLHLVPLPDRNGDGMADYELLYPSGDRQLAYYLGIEKPPEVLPPDPSTVATPIDPTVASLFDKNIAFLYRGTTPIQTGVAPNTFDLLRVAVIRGQVVTRDRQPLAGVLLTILQHPEVGQTKSRADGGFDLAVNGGGSVTVQYQKAGYLPVQRTLTVPWNDYALVAEVVMTPLDSQVTHLDLTAPTALQVARGSVVTDDDGTRQATLLFPPGTQATMTLPDGSTPPLTTLDIRATEYTVGATGPQAMPAELPPATGYTYAVEYSVDQALAAGATRVDFNQPIFAYVDNFLNFPAGTIVPAGWYDATNAAWNASDNGRVIQIRDVTLGQAVLDVTGSGQAASETDLAQLGLTAVELQQLAQLYPVGKSVWRVPLTHFSPWDFNFSLAAPPGATAPPVAGSSALPTPDDPDQQCGSVINCQSQVLGETLPVTGTPVTLTYRSERVPGQKVARTLTIPLPGGSSLPAYLGLRLEIQVAGRQVQLFWPPGTVPVNYQFTWDGRDAYGRVLQGQQPVQWRLGYQYLGQYVKGAGFAYRGNGLFLDTNGRPGNRQVSLWSAWQTASLGNLWDARGLGFGGWTLAPQHVYSPPARALLRGDGSQRQRSPILGGVLTTVTSPNQSNLLTVGPDGSVYFQATPLQIHRRQPDGTVDLVAGNGTNGYSQPGPNGQPATAVSLSFLLTDLQSDAQNRLSLAEMVSGAQGRVLRLAAGLLTTVAGGGTQPLPTGGTERLATTVALPEYLKLAPTPTGNLYVAAGVNLYTLTPAGLLRYEATFPWPSGWSITSLAVAPEGDVYVVLRSSNWGYASLGRLPPRGAPEAVASVALSQLAQVEGQGWPATLPAPQQVTVDATGTLYFLYDTLYSNNYGWGEIGNKQLLRLESDGRLTTVAGGGQPLDGLGDNGAATAAKLTTTTGGLARSPNGTLYLAQTPSGSQPGRLRRLSPALPGVTLADLEIAAADGSEIYHFSRDGRHLRTIDAVTGQTLAQFSYDANGYLIRLTDLDGDVTTIERDANSVPQAILAPDGQRTTLTVNANGYLTKLTNPAGETYQMVSSEA
jgi:YD repeat-containing protein